MKNKAEKILEIIILFLSLALSLFSKEITYIIIGIVLIAGLRLFFYNKKKHS
ncbi:hypothetical protein ACN6MY_05940 [Peribacillus sp. B-H-3]|uniref:hypothetical protein n=1 Tax=Peribacillus sp. B-H-3 TaxID=3400420 RepID=UPI003B01110E